MRIELTLFRTLGFFVAIFLTAASYSRSCRQFYTIDGLAFNITSPWHPKDGFGSPHLWTIDGPIQARSRYEIAFRHLFHSLGISTQDSWKGFERIFHSRKSEKKSNHVLDLFGSGLFLKESDQIDSVTGLRWESALQSEDFPKYWPIEVPTKEVLGDIYNLNTWDRMDQSMEEREIKKFSLITALPEGGWEKSMPKQYSNEAAMSGIRYLALQSVARLESDGIALFRLPNMNSDHSLIERTELAAIAKEIESKTSFRLVYSASSDGYVFKRDYINIAIVPKNSNFILF